MTSPQGGNPNPPTDAQPEEYPPRDCPLCGTTVKNLPAHLRQSCPKNE